MLRQSVGGRTAGEASPGVPHPKLLRVVESGVGAVRDRGVQEPAQRRPAVARAEGEQLRGGHGRPHPSLPVRAELLRGRGVPGDGGLRRQQHQHRALPLVATDQPHAVHGVVDPVQAAGEPPVQGEQRPAPRRPRPVEVGQVAGFIGIPRKIMALKILKAIIIDLNYIKGILFFLDLTGE